jgi:ribose 5-phosphate isomerase A
MTERPVTDRADQFKRAAAVAAVDLVVSGQVVGLGSGSTVSHVILELGERLRQGRLGDVLGVPSSEETARLAALEGIPLVEVGRSPMGIAIDGADEIAPDLSLTKGGGGALLREKVVAAAAYRFVVVADESKLVDRLGSTYPVPVEVATFGIRGTLDLLRRFGNPTLRTVSGEPFTTDNGNAIVDLQVEPIDHPQRMNELLSTVPGVLATGLFVGLAAEALVAGPGGVRTVRAR